MRITLLAAGFSVAFLFAPAALGQSAKSVAGAYAGVSFKNIDASGKTSDVFGPNPRAMMVLTPDGRYSIIVMRGELPKLASNSRLKGTPEENQAVVAGSIAHFGRYTVDEKDKSITFQVEASTFANWDGQSQKRPLIGKGDELKYTVPAPSTGMGTAEVTWKRLRPAP
jgi:sugar/nucleoside kinase (ribokinase family)